jgi:hypothetical protein
MRLDHHSWWSGATTGAQGTELLVTIGWNRAGGTAPPWGPKTPTLAQP